MDAAVGLLELVFMNLPLETLYTRVARNGFWAFLSWLAIVCGTPVLAQTSVSGVINTNTTWVADQGPYLLSGVVTVQNNAALTLEAGVQVHFAPGSALVVDSGRLLALGASDHRIVFTSERAPAGTAARGDWAGIQVQAQGSGSRFEYVDIEYGSGVQISGARVHFQGARLRFNQGAAIRIDLASSIAGDGNSATDNDLNAVSVPPGVISGDVDWSLRGIAFHLAGGTLAVGAAPTISAINPAVVSAGDVLTVHVAGSRLQGAQDVQFDPPVITLQGAPSATDTEVQLAIAVAPDAAVGPVRVSLLTDAGAVTAQDVLAVAASQPRLDALAPAQIYVGQGAVDITLSGRGMTPQSVVLVDGVAVPSSYLSQTQIRATIPSQNAPGVLHLSVRTPDPQAQGQFFVSTALPLTVSTPVLSLAPKHARVIKGQTQALTLTLPYAAPQGGVLIHLASSAPSAGTVPAQISVPEGATSQSLVFAALELGSTTITATSANMGSAAAHIDVIAPPRLMLTPLTAAVGVGRVVALNLGASEPAPEGGLSVALSSAAAGVAVLDAGASAMIAAGQTSVHLPVRGVSVGQSVVEATAQGFESARATVNVHPLTLSVPPSAWVAPGRTRSVPISLSDPAPAGGLELHLVSSDPSVLTVTDSVTVPEGQSSVNVNIVGVVTGSARVSVSGNGYQGADLAVTVEAVQISLGSTLVRLPQGMSMGSYTVTLSRPAPAGGVRVALDMADTAIATVAPAHVEIPEGQTAAALTPVAVTGVAKGSTTLTLSAAGLAPVSVAVTVIDPLALRLGTHLGINNPLTIGKGFKTYYAEVFVTRQSGNTTYSGSESIDITLTSSDPSKVRVPEKVTLAAGYSTAYFEVTGVDLTEGAPVTIHAQASGHLPPQDLLKVVVEAPKFGVCKSDSQRTVVGGRDDVGLCYPGRAHSNLYYGLSPAAPITIDWSVVEDTPTGLLPGFYNQSIGGTLVTQSVWNPPISSTGQSSDSPVVWASTPTQTGSYKIQASVAGLATVTSDTVTVSAPQLRFRNASSNLDPASLALGKGFKTYHAELLVAPYAGNNAVTVSQPLTIALSSSDPTKVRVPTIVTVPASQNVAYFEITAVDFTDIGAPVTIDASAAGYNSPTTKLQVTVEAPKFTVCDVDGARTVVSARDSVRLCYDYRAHSGVYYPLSPATDLTIDWQVVEDTPSGLVPGFYDAANGGQLVSQSTWAAPSNNGLSSSSAAVWVATPTAAGTYKLQGSIANVGSAASGVVTVSAPELRFRSQYNMATPLTLGKGFKTHVWEVNVGRYVGNGPLNAAEPVTIALTSADPSKVSVPATVTIPAGQSTVNFEVTAVDFTGSTPVQIDASASGYTAPSAKLMVAVEAPKYTVCGVESTRTVISPRDDVLLCYRERVHANTWYQLSPATDLTVDWRIVDDTPAGLVPGFFDDSSGARAIVQTTWFAPAGNGMSSSNRSAWTATPVAAGSYKVQGEIAGLTAATSAAVTVAQPQLRFFVGGYSSTSMNVGKGLKTASSVLAIHRLSGNTALASDVPVTIHLACTSTAVCRVPETVTIPAGTDRVSVQVEGVELGSTTITAWATGYTSPPDQAVSVVLPELGTYYNWTTSLVAGQSRAVAVQVCVPGSPHPYQCTHAAVSELTVDLLSSDPTVVSVPASVTIPAGASVSQNFNLTGVSPGSATVSASGNGLKSISANISVTP